MKLYQTYHAIEQLREELEDVLVGEDATGPDGDPMSPEEAIEQIAAAIARISDERDRKALNIACLIKNLRSEAVALKTEKLRLQRRQKAAERTAERLTQYLEDFLEPGTRINDARARIQWRQSRAVNCWVDPCLLPNAFQRVKVEANLTAIRAALNAGKEVAGAEIQTRNLIQIH